MRRGVSPSALFLVLVLAVTARAQSWFCFIDLIPQQGSYTCWAASAEMAMRYRSLNHNSKSYPTQCQQAGIKTGYGNACCPLTSHPECDVRSYPLWSRYTGPWHADSNYTALSMGSSSINVSVKGQIENDYPWLFSWRLYSGGGYYNGGTDMHICSGYTYSAGTPYLEYYDAYYDNTEYIQHSQYGFLSGYHTLDMNYYNIN